MSGHREKGILFVMILSFLGLWLDVALGHVPEGVNHYGMWVPLILLPFSAVICGVLIFCQKKWVLLSALIIWILLIISGLLGVYFHAVKLGQAFHNHLQWEVLVRMMRYPPVLAPLSMCGLGILLAMIYRRK